ncbi:glycosyltransferase family 2 protein [Leptothoe spongobia TAU-MAC 1115]|uniref:Glycosyltransferase family 2 protein n=2 Tax=Leptothoe TaxID=2651725 RepID=A0A947DJ49_9CYAN|nr:glycosyltransferase family 2 protein [Leptothoe spongobia TAU-MAC 1115]
MPKVSVIIAAYNSMHYLPQTLDSVLAQTFQDFEIIIVDDGSSDHIKTWATSLTQPNIKFFSQANAGSAAARNTALSHATGAYIAFLDADDLWDKRKLETHVQALDNNPKVGLVYSWVATMDEYDRPQGKICKNSESGDVLPRLIEHDIIECGSNPMIRRECFTQVGEFDTRFPYAQTWEMWLRIAMAYPFYCVQEPLVRYRFHPGNTSKKWQKMEANYHAIIEKVFAIAPQHYQPLKGRSYGFAYLRIAWKTLQNLDGDCQPARQFRKQALTHCPKLRFSSQCVRLSIAIIMVQLFGLDGYSQLRTNLHHLKNHLTQLPKFFSVSASS